MTVQDPDEHNLVMRHMPFAGRADLPDAYLRAARRCVVRTGVTVGYTDDEIDELLDTLGLVVAA